jgi:hypothetical protein
MLNQEESKKLQNRAHLLTDLRGGSKGKELRRVHAYIPSNLKEKGLEIAPRKFPRKGSEKHKKERTGTTHPNLEEPHRIINTSQRDSYKV